MITGGEKRNAFTLIELMVVLAILALLATMVARILGRSIERGRFATCTSNLRQVCAAMLLYADDHDGCLALGHEWVLYRTGSIPGVYCHEEDVVDGALFPYIREADVFVCPTFRKVCRAEPENVARSYAITAGIKKFKSHNGLSRVRQMAEPSSTILFTEENDWAVPGYSRAGYDDTYFAAFPAPRNAIASFHLVNERHRNEGVGNCAFFDGHVAAHSIAETTNLAYNYQ